MKVVRLKIKSLNNSKFTSHLILAFCLSIFIFSCCKKDDPSPEPILEISQEIKNLIYFQGDEKASTVLVNVQGGPDTALSKELVDSISTDYDTTGILLVNVHQAQTLNPSILDGFDITLDVANNFNAQSIEMLHKVIQYFKDQDRTVYVLGNSFGAFMVQELIAEKGIDVADKYLIMIGRLDMNDVMWQALDEGKFGYFIDGVTPIINQESEVNVADRNIGRIAAGLGMHRYTQKFESIEDMSKVTYVYGSKDQFVGSLTAGEVLFLTSKNVNIIAGEGDHDETFRDFLPQGLSEAFGIEK